MKSDALYLVQLSENFKGYEFRCRGHELREPCSCNGAVAADTLLLALLQAYRSDTGKPVWITNGGGLRCNTYNKHVGGFVRSDHRLGKAADITSRAIQDSSRIEDEAHRIGDLAQTLLPDGYGLIRWYPNNNFIHMGVGATNGPLVDMKESSVTSRG